MKTSRPFSFWQILRAVFLALVAFSLFKLPAQAQTWTGAGGGNWGTNSSWTSNVTFGNATNLTFSASNSNASSTTTPSFLGASRTIQGLTFDANADSDFFIRLTTTNAVTTAATLTFQAAAGDASLTVDSGATGNFNIGASVASALGGNIVLGSNLTIDHNGTGIVVIERGISGSGRGITKNGTGTLILSGSNSYNGTVTLNAGQLNINHTNALGSATVGTFVINGGTINNTSAGLVTVGAKPLIINNDFTYAGGNQSLILTTGATSLGTASGASRTITVNANTLTLGGIIANGNTANSIIKEGAGALTLSGANTFTGGVTLNAGTLNINNALALGNATTGTFVINGGTIDNTSAGLITVGAKPLTINSDFTYTGGNQSLHLGTGAATLGTSAGSSRAITVSGNYLEIGGIISDGTSANGITKQGAGTLRLTGNNSYSGQTTISSGTLQLGNNTASGSLSSSGTIVNNGTLVFRNTGVLTQGTNFSSTAITGTGMVIQNSANSTTLNNIANSFSGGVWVQGGGAVWVDSIGNNGSNSFLGSGGTIKLGDSTNAGTLRITGNGTETTDKVIDLSGTTGGGTITNLSSNITFSSDLAMSGSGAKTLTLASSGSNTSTTTFNGLLSDANGVLSLRMNGSGNAIFGLGNAANSFNGSLILDGNINGKTYTLSVAGIGNATQNSYFGRNATINIGSSVAGTTNVLKYIGLGETTDKVINLIGTNGSVSALDQSGASGLLKFTSSMTASTVGNKTLVLQGSAGGTGEMAGVISDSGVGNATSLAKLGTGSWILSANNTYTGTTTIGSSNGTTAGTLQLSGAGAISNAATTIFGGTLDLNGTNQTITTLLMGGGASGSTSSINTGSGTLTLGGAVTYNATNNPGNATIAGNLNLGGAARTFTVNSSTGSGGVELLLSANISNDGGAGLTKAGTGVLELSGVNSYTGNTTISGTGSLRVSSIANQGQNSAVGAGSKIELVGTTSLVYTGSGVTTDRIISSNATGNNPLQTLSQSGTGSLKFTSDLALSGNFSRTLVLSGNSSGTGEFAGNIANLASSNLTAITKTGSGTWTLSGNNSYTGITTINGADGLFIVGSANGISGGLGQSGLSGIQFDSGILGLTAESGNFTRTIGNTNGNGTRLGSTSLDKGFAAFGGNRSIVFNNSATTTINLGFNQQITGGLILGHSSADSTITFVNPLGLYVADTRTIIVNNGSAAIDGVVSGNITTASGAWTAASIFQINGNGTLAFTGTANTFGNGSAAGQTFLAINQATLQIGNNGTTGMIGSGANATVQGDIQNDGVLRIALTSNQTINNIIKGNGSFSNVSTGRIALNGANTYTGNTTVSAGTLALGSGGSIANSSLITVVAGATLDVASAPGGFVLGASQTLTGSGSVVGSATINGHLRPSSSPGVLSFSSDLTLGSGANLQMEINGNGTRGIAYDGINVAGALTYGGSLELVIDSPFAPGDYTFDLLSGFSSQTGNFTSVSLSGAYAGSFLRTGEVWELTSSGNTWTLDQLSGDLAVSVVPEPSTWALLALAVGTLLLTRARRRKSSSSP